jgi:hypothetical protein
MNRPRLLPKKPQPGFGHLCHTLRAYSNANRERHLFDEAHRAWRGDYPAHSIFLANVASREQKEMPRIRKLNAPVSVRFNCVRLLRKIF